MESWELDGPLRRLLLAVLTGFLGSGKTTVLNYLTQQPALSRTLVIFNEFGEIGPWIGQCRDVPTVFNPCQP